MCKLTSLAEVDVWEEVPLGRRDEVRGKRGRELRERARLAQIHQVGDQNELVGIETAVAVHIAIVMLRLCYVVFRVCELQATDRMIND